ncbi:hypothetical protein Tco_0353541 [Tanacetum coccineum]
MPDLLKDDMIRDNGDEIFATRKNSLLDDKERKARTYANGFSKVILRRFLAWDDAKEIWAAIKTRHQKTSSSSLTMIMWAFSIQDKKPFRSISQAQSESYSSYTSSSSLKATTTDILVCDEVIHSLLATMLMMVDLIHEDLRSIDDLGFGKKWNCKFKVIKEEGRQERVELSMDECISEFGDQEAALTAHKYIVLLAKASLMKLNCGQEVRVTTIVLLSEWKRTRSVAKIDRICDHIYNLAYGPYVDLPQCGVSTCKLLSSDYDDYSVQTMKLSPEDHMKLMLRKVQKLEDGSVLKFGRKNCCSSSFISMGLVDLSQWLHVTQKPGRILYPRQYVAEILKKFDLVNVKSAFNPWRPVPLTKDEEAFECNPKTFIQCVKRFFSIQGQNKLGLWYLGSHPLIWKILDSDLIQRIEEPKGKEQVEDIAKHLEAAKNLSKVASLKSRLLKRKRLQEKKLDQNWDLIRAKLEANAELSKNILGSEIQGEDFAKKMVDLVNQRKKFFAEKRAKAKRNKPMTQSQLKILNFYTNTKDDEPTKKSGKRRKQIARKGMHTSVDKNDSEESDKVDEQEETNTGTETPINPVPVAIKTPSVATYKIIKQGEKGVYQIVREDGTDIVYINFGAMLKSISRDDLTELYRIVMNRYGLDGPEDKLEKGFWKCLRIMVHCLNLESMEVYMLSERKYPLSAEKQFKFCQHELKSGSIIVNTAWSGQLDTLEKEEEAKQVHLDSLLAQRLAEEEELNEQQKKRRAQVQFEARITLNEDLGSY